MSIDFGFTKQDKIIEKWNIIKEVLYYERLGGVSVVLLFHYLSLLNIFDAGITYFGLENGFIQESNPLMNSLYEADPALFIFTKLALSLFLYLFIFLKKVPTSVHIKRLTVFATSFYTLVFFLHCYWLLF